MAKEYKFPVWATQGGGLVREVSGTYIFVEKPECRGLDVGDEMPSEWGIIPANEGAHNQMATDQAYFNASIDDFFERLFARVERGDMTISQMGRFFPQDVRNRNA